MGERLAGKPVADSIKKDIAGRVAYLEENEVIPRIMIFRVGARPEDISYEKGILKAADALGIKIDVAELSLEVSTEDLISMVRAAGDDDEVNGIMMFRPLPPYIDEKAVIEAINPAKDIDCMTSRNLAGVFAGEDVFAPCTPEAVIEMLKFYGYELSGANVAVLGRSMVVGKPLSMLLLKENATVTVLHSRTKNRQEITKNSPVVISAMGRAKMLGADDFSSDAVVIDVGINDDGNGGICGDVDYDAVIDNVKALNPAIGGLGTVTTSLLLKHAVVAAEKMHGCERKD